MSHGLGHFWRGFPAGREGFPAGREGFPAGREGFPAGWEGFPARRDWHLSSCLLFQLEGVLDAADFCGESFVYLEALLYSGATVDDGGMVASTDELPYT